MIDLTALGYRLRMSTACPGDYVAFVGGLLIQAYQTPSGSEWVVRCGFGDSLRTGMMYVSAMDETLSGASEKVSRVILRECPKMAATLWPALVMGGAA